MLVTWILVGVWAVIALGFFAAMIAEARKFEAEIGFVNVVVAAIWPLWLLWYSTVIIGEWWKRRKWKS